MLLEIGLIGVSLLVVMTVLAVRLVLKNPMRGLIMSLMVAYGVSLMFFSGFANALQIYLLPMVLMALFLDIFSNDMSDPSMEPKKTAMAAYFSVPTRPFRNKG